MIGQIVTPRLVLRPVSLADTAALLPLFNDWAVIKWLSAPPWPYSEADMRGYFAALLASPAPDREVFLVIERQGQPIGGISHRMRRAGRLQSGDGPNIGYWLARSHWGHGYMTEAACHLIQHLFTTTQANAIYSGAFEGNTPSLHVQEKLGFARGCVTMLRSNPRQLDLPHTNTVLTRATYETLKRSPHAIS